MRSRTAGPGDIFVQKAPAATILTLAEALKEIFDADNEIQILGTRHGEKLYETLLTAKRWPRRRIAATTIAFRPMSGT